MTSMFAYYARLHTHDYMYTQQKKKVKIYSTLMISYTN